MSKINPARVFKNTSLLERIVAPNLIMQNLKPCINNSVSGWTVSPEPLLSRSERIARFRIDEFLQGKKTTENASVVKDYLRRDVPLVTSLPKAAALHAVTVIQWKNRFVYFWKHFHLSVLGRTSHRLDSQKFYVLW